MWIEQFKPSFPCTYVDLIKYGKHIGYITWRENGWTKIMEEYKKYLHLCYEDEWEVLWL